MSEVARANLSDEELQRAADVWGLRRALRDSGLYVFFVGVFAVAVPLRVYNAPFTHPVVITGMVLMISAVVSILAPNPRLLLMNGVALVFLSAALVGMEINAFIAHPQPGFIVGLLLFGLPFLVYGLGALRKYRAYASTRRADVSPDAMKQIENTYREISSGDVSKAEDLIELLAGVQSWRARLAGKRAIFLNRSTNRMLFVKRAEVSIQVVSELTADFDRVAVGVRGLTLKALMSKTSVERLKRWKS